MSSPPPPPPPPLPAPHSMCSPLECSDRQSHMELHLFESTVGTYAYNPRHRVADPRLSVKKYRRSAAGGGVRSYDDDGRTVSDLEGTIEHLLGTLVPRQRTFSADVMPPRTLGETASFVDDRIRAVQVDLITSLGGGNEGVAAGGGGSGGSSRSVEEWVRVRRMQARLVRYGVLMQYLLSDLPPEKHEAKFGWTALRTALGAYFASWDALDALRGNAVPSSSSDDNEIYIADEDDDEREARRERDEIRSYAALLHLSSVVRSRERALPSPPAGIGCADENGAGIGALLASSWARRKGRRRAGQEEKKEGTTDADEAGGGRADDDRRWMRALEVASAAEAGNYVRLFRLLCDEDEDNEEESFKACSTKKSSVGENRRYRILSRCCLVQCLNAIRIDALRRYNKSLGKNEKVPASDLADLLRLPSAEAAVEFCTSAGLPAVASREGGELDRVVMKAAPICVTAEDKVAARRMGRPGREEDAFVFGKGWYEDVWEGKRKPSTPAAPPRKSVKKEGPEKKKEEEKDPFAGMSSLQIAMAKMKLKDQPPPPPEPDDWEDREDDSFEDVEAKKMDDDEDEDDLERKARTDDDGVVVPPGRVLMDFLR